MRKSTFPKWSTHSFRARVKVSGFVTSAAKATTFDPDFSHAAAVAFRPASSMSTMTRLTWSSFANSSAVALANPEPTPDMTATFPFNDSPMERTSLDPVLSFEKLGRADYDISNDICQIEFTYSMAFFSWL